MNPAGKPTNEEIAVAKWIKANVFSKKTKFLSHTVEYFTASKAVDKLLTSPWSKPGKNGEDPIFTTRESIVVYLDLLLRKKFFHRAKKIPVSEQELKARSKKKEKKKEKEESSKKDKSEAEEEKKEEKKVEDADSSHAEEKKEVKTKKEKRKIRLDMHLEQQFVDGNDAYVWIYDPIPYYYWLAGGGVVLAVVALCLFPLWPPIVRKGVYYLSVGAAGFLMFILGLAVLRVLVFCLLWLVSMGRHHLWLFPNLTEDVGFFASFWPLWKVYTVNDESQHLLIQGVPAIAVTAELEILCQRFGSIDYLRNVPNYPAEKFCEVYHVKFHTIQSARFAKRQMDDRSFYGGVLHVCYAPELETVEDTRHKLDTRIKEIAEKLNPIIHRKKFLSSKPASADPYHEVEQPSSAVSTPVPAETTESNISHEKTSQPRQSVAVKRIVYHDRHKLSGIPSTSKKISIGIFF
nr:EOG090X0D00 [Eurycercus lamellatus]